MQLELRHVRAYFLGQDNRRHSSFHSNNTVQTVSIEQPNPQNLEMENETLPAVSMPTASTSIPGPVHSLFHTPCDVSDISSAGENKRHNNADHLPVEDSDESDEYGNDLADATETDFDINHIKSINDLDSLTNDHPLLVYQQPLLDLANTQISSLCKVCNANISVAMEIVASATYLKWVGNTYYFFLRYANFQILKISPYNVYTHWKITSHLAIQQGIFCHHFHLGDGRMDNPGQCAQYCSYTFMEYTTKKILCITTMDKRSTDRKSTNLEKASFLKGMNFFKGIKVVEVVTDAHVQIASISQEKELLVWVKDIVNHYWHTAEVATTSEEFLDVWYGVLHHVVNEHQWFVPFANSTFTNGCQHGPLKDGTQSREYLKKGSPSHNELRKL
ncbi:unnamed protein product [Mytilus coruscus]|uniref:Uncharacterized protein n=1 Tax=Mytilus coruscus TaxID=42192 RepID=A0A6J8A4B0_MYTCO|nr:unnamed protein product [Mytilus coruscus]